jgi:hypothetical protein
MACVRRGIFICPDARGGPFGPFLGPARFQLMSRAGAFDEPASSAVQKCVPDARDCSSLTLLRGTPSHFFVPNSGPYYGIRQAISLNTFQSSTNSPWPTAQVDKGKAVGYAQLVPSGFENNAFVSTELRAELAERMYMAAAKLSDSDADVLDLLCAVWVDQAKKPSDSATVAIDQLLAMRGLQPKRGEGRRKSGYRENQRASLRESIERLESLWVTLSRLEVYRSDENRRRARRQVIAVQSRALILTDRMVRENPDGRADLLRFHFRPGDILGPFLFGLGRQIALLAAKVVQYDPYHQKLEKRLARHFSWQWRIRAASAAYLVPFTVKTLLKESGIDLDRASRPSRIRERLERALETLEEDNVIKGWQYEAFDASVMTWRNWRQVWLNARVVVEPPDTVTDTYLSIVRPESAINSRSIGQRIRGTRLCRNLTLLVAAQEIGIDHTLLCRIENGSRRPSRAVARSLESWMEQIAGR